MMGLAVEIVDLSVGTRGRALLSIERLEIAAGEFVAVMGPNGAGKSTLLRTCLGMQRQVQGRVTILKESLGRMNAMGLTRVRRLVGYVPQLLPTHSELPLTVREVVSIGRTGIAGLFRPLGKGDWHVIDEWIDRLGLSPLAARPFSEISGGEQRKTVIARAMAQEPKLLLLDEPTANLDLGWRERIVEILEAIYQRARLSVVLVCHDLEALPPSCRQVVILDRGQVLAIGPPERILSDELVGRLYGPNLIVRHQNGRHAIIPRGSER